MHINYELQMLKNKVSWLTFFMQVVQVTYFFKSARGVC